MKVDDEPYLMPDVALMTPVQSYVGQEKWRVGHVHMYCNSRGLLWSNTSHESGGWAIPDTCCGFNDPSAVPHRP